MSKTRISFPSGSHSIDTDYPAVSNGLSPKSERQRIYREEQPCCPNHPNVMVTGGAFINYGIQLCWDCVIKIPPKQLQTLKDLQALKDRNG
jgi:hypothetical protein